MYRHSRMCSAPLQLALIGGLVFVGACGGSRSMQSLDQQLGRSAIARDRIAYSSGESAYDLVHRLRPEFFTSARLPLDSERLVYVNGFRSAGVEALRGIPAGWVQEIRFLNAGEAMLAVGGGQYSGAVMIKLRRVGHPTSD
ncbi:MAG: hypothetical protein ACJ77R_03560 [Gemmatimonadaceae bacterium]